MIRHVILTGIYDEEIRRDVYGQVNLDNMDVAQLISLIEGKETARDATSSSGSASAISLHKRKQREARTVDVDKKAKCNTCSNLFNVFKKMANGRYNKIPFVDCQDCWKKKNNRTKNYANQKDGADANAISFNISSYELNQEEPHVELNSISGGVVLNHHVFTNGDWKLQLAQPHPTIEINVSTSISDYTKLNLPYVAITNYPVTAIVDSGAQCCLWGWKECQESGFRKCDLVPVKQKLNAVSKSSIEIFGAVILRMCGQSPSGCDFNCASLVCLAKRSCDVFISRGNGSIENNPRKLPISGCCVKHSKSTC